MFSAAIGRVTQAPVPAGCACTRNEDPGEHAERWRDVRIYLRQSRSTVHARPTIDASTSTCENQAYRHMGPISTHVCMLDRSSAMELRTRAHVHVSRGVTYVFCAATFDHSNRMSLSRTSTRMHGMCCSADVRVPAASDVRTKDDSSVAEALLHYGPCQSSRR